MSTGHDLRARSRQLLVVKGGVRYYYVSGEARILAVDEVSGAEYWIKEVPKGPTAARERGDQQLIW